MADLWLLKAADGSLRASSEQEEDYLRKLKVGDVVAVTIRKPRNGKHHRLGMAMLREVFNNQDSFTVWEHFLDEVKILTGLVDTYIRPSGEVIYKVRSISFDKMDELEFSEWKDVALKAVFEHFIPAMNDRDRERVINSLLARM